MHHTRLLLLAIVPTFSLAAATPPDHIVIVIEENHSFQDVIGSPDAPYMNALAQGGASFHRMFAITHPSQPNYIQFFSGASQGITTNNFPTGLPLSAPNLASALFAAGKTFISYCEDLPAAGSQVEISGSYFRKHNPAPNWQVDPPLTPGPNQFGPEINQPFTAFPSDFTQLPTVSLVVPNQLHDMHDGTIAQADQWLVDNIQAYANWCQANNSLLIITWDEDSFLSRLQIPTIFHGPMVRTGPVESAATLHDLLNMVCTLYQADAPGAGADCAGIIGTLRGEPFTAVRSFAQDENGYTSAADTMLDSATPGTSHAADTVLVADGSPASQVLIRFDDLFGANAGQVPAGATILSAKLMLLTGAVSSDSSLSPMAAHRLLIPWAPAATWNTLGAGIAADGVEAAPIRDFALTANTTSTWAVFDVTGSVQGWATNPASNQGWAIIPGGTDGWRFASSESALIADRPRLEITFLAAPACPADINDSGSVTVQDVFDFLAAFFANAPQGDFNADDAFSPQDIFAFLAAFFAPCS